MATPKVDLSEDEYAAFVSRVKARPGRKVQMVIADLIRAWMAAESDGLKKDPARSFTPAPKSDIPICAEDHRLDLLREILESGHPRAVPAITANLECFAELVRGADISHQAGSSDPVTTEVDGQVSDADAARPETRSTIERAREDLRGTKRDDKRRRGGAA
jgi:hypothetical protein